MGFDANDLAVAASDEALRLDPLSAPGVANAIAYRQVRNPAAALANAAALLRLGGHPEFNGDAAASFKFVQRVPFSQRRVRRRPHRVCLPRSALYLLLSPPPPQAISFPFDLCERRALLDAFAAFVKAKVARWTPSFAPPPPAQPQGLRVGFLSADVGEHTAGANVAGVYF